MIKVISKSGLLVRSPTEKGVKTQYKDLTIESSTHEIHLSNHRHRLEEKVCSYFPDWVKDIKNNNRFELGRATIVNIDPLSLSYSVDFDDFTNEFGENVSESYVFNRPNNLFEPGQRVMACWPRFAQNKNCPERYKKFPATIVKLNPDATYHIRYDTSPYMMSLLRSVQPKGSKEPALEGPTPQKNEAETVREMWVAPPAKFVLKHYEQLNRAIYSNSGSGKDQSSDENQGSLIEETFFERFPPHIV